MLPRSAIHDDALQSLLGKRSRSKFDDDDYPRLSKPWRVEPELVLRTTNSAPELSLFDSTPVFDFALPGISRPADAPHARLGMPVLDHSTTPRVASRKELHMASESTEAHNNPSHRDMTASSDSEQVDIPGKDGRQELVPLPTTNRFQARAPSSSSRSDIRTKRSYRIGAKAEPAVTLCAPVPSAKQKKDDQRRTTLSNRASHAPRPGQGFHKLHDYQMQLMLLEQQNKKRLLMAREEQDKADIRASEQNANKTSAEIEKERHGPKLASLTLPKYENEVNLNDSIYMKDTISQDLTTDNILNRLRGVQARKENRIKDIATPQSRNATATTS